MSNQVRFIEEDVSDLLNGSINVCLLQLKSPFFDECGVGVTGSNNLLVWKPEKLANRTGKILSILSELMKYRENINIIVMPEYAIQCNMIKDLQSFADTNKVILISTFYDDRPFIENKKNKNYRKNVLSLILPNRCTTQIVTKLEKTTLDADFLSDSNNKKIEIARLYWIVNREKNEKLYLQIFICGDFLEYFPSADREKGGIIIVPMSSPEIKSFQAVADFCVRPRRDWKTERCVLLCNSITIGNEETSRRMCGCSQVFGPYKGILPRLDAYQEGGIITTIKATNIITQPSAVPSRYNIVVENPVSFALLEEKGKWSIQEKRVSLSRPVINPLIFESFGLGTYFGFARLRDYWFYRPYLSKSLTKCVGIQGRDDIITQCLAPDNSIAQMLLFCGRSDLAAQLQNEFSPLYFHVGREKGYIKYKGIEVNPEPLPSSVIEEAQKYRGELFKIAKGTFDYQANSTLIKKMREKKIIIGDEKTFDIEDAKEKGYAEYLIGIFLPIREKSGLAKSCEVFEKAIIRPDLVDNPAIKEIFYSSGVPAGDNQLAVHYLIRVIGNSWEITEIVLGHIIKPLFEKGIVCATRVMAFCDYLSDAEYEWLLSTPIHEPSKRHILMEIMNLLSSRIGQDFVIVSRLSEEDIDKIIKIYKEREKIAITLNLELKSIDEKIFRLLQGIMCKKFANSDCHQAFDCFADLFENLAKHAEKTLIKNINEKREQIGQEKFDEEISKHTNKVKTDALGLATSLMTTRIWNSSCPNNPIVSLDYGKHVKKLQASHLERNRNYFIHPQIREKAKFMLDKEKLNKDIDDSLETIMALTDFILEFS